MATPSLLVVIPNTRCYSGSAEKLCGTSLDSPVESYEDEDVITHQHRSVVYGERAADNIFDSVRLYCREFHPRKWGLSLLVVVVLFLQLVLVAFFLPELERKLYLMGIQLPLQLGQEEGDQN